MGGRGSASGFVTRLPNHQNATIAERKITEYLLKPGTKHYQDFIDVGYSANNPEKLRNDILNGLKTNKALSFEENQHGNRAYQVDMELGITHKKLFRTSWQVDKGKEFPKLTSAYRISRRG